jgi:hypothetical protein
MLRLVFLSLALATAGCASRAYVVPVDGPRATIKYRLVSPGPEASVFTHVDSKCAERKWMGGMKGTPRPSDKLQTEFATTIAANRPFHTSVFLDVSNATYCGVNWEFVPNEGASYEADVSYADEKCDVKLYQIAGSSRTLLESPPATCK